MKKHFEQLPLKLLFAFVPLTIVHTNDIHSHFRPDKGPFGLGGIARIATTIKKIREDTRNSLVLDGGDWSEGSIYYNLNAGRTALEMLNKLGYDAAVLGNHDWLNGPDQLLKILKQTPPQFKLVASNLDFSQYERSKPRAAAELKKFFSYNDASENLYEKLGAKVFDFGEGENHVRVGVIGMSTYALIFEKYFAPVDTINPYALTRKIAAELKEKAGADFVILISHNELDGPFPTGNRWLAGLPNVDLVIHSHDHRKLTKPIRVERQSDGKVSYIVETGCWGYFVGRLDLLIDKNTKRFELQNYNLIQQDESIPEDPEVKAMIDSYDEEILTERGNERIFSDHIADSTIHLRRESQESLFGNILTDAYRDFEDPKRANAKAEIAFDYISLTSGEIYPGPINTVDVYNALTPIWKPETKKAWTLKTMKMTGLTLDWLLNLILTYGHALPKGMPNASGLRAVYVPPVDGGGELNLRSLPGPQDKNPQDPIRRALKYLEVQGQPINLRRTYLVAMGEGILETLRFLESRLDGRIDRIDELDTGVEDWKILADYIQKISPVESHKIPRGGRLVMLKPDLAVYHDEIQTFRDGTSIRVDITIRNLGGVDSTPRRVRLRYDQTPLVYADDPYPSAAQKVYLVPAIPSETSLLLHTEIQIPTGWERISLLPLYVDLEASKDDPNTTNDRTWIISH